MEASNAFDMLILPMLEWFAGILASMPILHALRTFVGYLIGPTVSRQDLTGTEAPADDRASGFAGKGPRALASR